MIESATDFESACLFDETNSNRPEALVSRSRRRKAETFSGRTNFESGWGRGAASLGLEAKEEFD